MKKYLFGLTAIALGLLLVSFTGPNVLSSKRVTHIFNYTAPGGSFSEANVENNALWNTTTITCPVGNIRACKFTVDESYTKLVMGLRVLRNSSDGAPFISIIAEVGSGAQYRVSAATANISAISNRPVSSFQ